MKISILGTTYDVSFSTTDKDIELEQAHGYCDIIAKKIVLNKNGDGFPTGTDEFNIFVSNVIRHEIVHAYLYESGLTANCYDEQIVEWIAQQLPKMVETINKATNILNQKR